MKNKTSQTLFAYWNEIRGPRVAPNRFEIEPARISSILAETFILERDQNAAFHFRLAGTRICEVFGREFRGQNVLTMWSPEDSGTLERVLKDIAFEGAVGVVSIEGTTQSGNSAPLEVLALPIVHAGNAITRILGSISATDTPPAWLGTTPIVQQNITCVNMIWPDGRPHAVLQRSRTQTPFSPLPEHKRIVSNNRRNFRVFDGGRTGPASPVVRPERSTD